MDVHVDSEVVTSMNCLATISFPVDDQGSGLLMVRGALEHDGQPQVVVNLVLTFQG